MTHLLLIIFSLFTLSLHADPELRTFLINAQDMQKLKNHVSKNDPNFESALQALIHEANNALASGPFSVIEKKLVPSSNNIHDYMSLARYWWPDPTKENCIPYIHRDCETNPEIWGDYYDYGRMNKMLNACMKLCLAYFLTANEKYAQHAALLIRTWFLNPDTCMNPHLNFSQSVPGVRSGGHNGIIEAYQFPVLFDCIGLLAESTSWTKEDYVSMQNWAVAYLRWLLTSPNGIRESKSVNNHASWYDVQVLYFALYTYQSHFAKRYFTKNTVKKLKDHFLEDGTQPHELIRDKSFHYCIYNLQALFNCALLGKHFDKDLWEIKTTQKGTLRKGLDLLLPYLRGEKTWVKKDIEPVDPAMAAPLLLIAYIVYQDPNYFELYLNIMQEQSPRENLRLFYPIPFLN